MFFLKIISFIFIFQLALANEDSKENNSSKESETPSLNDQSFSGKQSLEWTEVQTRLAALKAKVDMQETLVKNLIIEKSNSATADKLKVIEQLKIEHQKWIQYIADYNQLRNEYQIHFPEKGVKETRTYKRVDSKSIEGVEKELTLEGRLNQLHKKVLKQYPKYSSSADASPAAPNNKKPKSEKKSDGVTDQIIFQK